MPTLLELLSGYLSKGKDDATMIENQLQDTLKKGKEVQDRENSPQPLNRDVTSQQTPNNIDLSPELQLAKIEEDNRKREMQSEATQSLPILSEIRKLRELAGQGTNEEQAQLQKIKEAYEKKKGFQGLGLSGVGMLIDSMSGTNIAPSLKSTYDPVEEEKDILAALRGIQSSKEKNAQLGMQEAGIRAKLAKSGDNAMSTSMAKALTMGETPDAYRNKRQFVEMIDEMGDKFNKYGWEAFTKDAASMRSLASQLKSTYKNAEGYGAALNAAEISFIEDVLPDPTSITGAAKLAMMGGKDAYIAMLNQIRKKIAKSAIDLRAGVEGGFTKEKVDKTWGRPVADKQIAIGQVYSQQPSSVNQNEATMQQATSVPKMFQRKK